MDLSALIQQCTPSNVSTQTMSHIMTVESAFVPHAIGYKLIGKDGKVYQLQRKTSSVEEAIQWATWFDAHGIAYDAGAAQVHSTNFSRYGLTTRTAFDACSNIRAGALILTDCYARALPVYKNEQIALRAALSCYQSGNFSTGFKTGYVDRVVRGKPQ